LPKKRKETKKGTEKKEEKRRRREEEKRKLRATRVFKNGRRPTATSFLPRNSLGILILINVSNDDIVG
jgi:hypothetical protein